jgi:hypothetical protein
MTQLDSAQLGSFTALLQNNHTVSSATRILYGDFEISTAHAQINFNFDDREEI